VLEEALEQYTGTIVFISHDRYFIDRIATSTCEMKDGKLDQRPGSYEDYAQRLRALEKAPAPKASLPELAPPVGEAQAAGAKAAKAAKDPKITSAPKSEKGPKSSKDLVGAK